jgi:signal transduction histidine kinase
VTDEIPTSADRLRVVAHELRSPVAALMALADAAPALRGPAERRRLLDLAVAAGRDIERILSDPELLSLRPVLVDVGGLVAGLAADRVVVAVEGRPEARADATRLRQAIANLVANGLRHGMRVAIQVAEKDGEVVVEVTDDGPGVSPGLDPFARGMSGAGSSGLGLWLARAIAEAHGGSLVLLPGTEPGARFRLALPSASGAG